MPCVATLFQGMTLQRVALVTVVLVLLAVAEVALGARPIPQTGLPPQTGRTDGHVDQRQAGVSEPTDGNMPHTTTVDADGTVHYHYHFGPELGAEEQVPLDDDVSFAFDAYRDAPTERPRDGIPKPRPSGPREGDGGAHFIYDAYEEYDKEAQRHDSSGHAQHGPSRGQDMPAEDPDMEYVYDAYQEAADLQHDPIPQGHQHNTGQDPDTNHQHDHKNFDRDDDAQFVYDTYQETTERCAQASPAPREVTRPAQRDCEQSTGGIVYDYHDHDQDAVGDVLSSTSHTHADSGAPQYQQVPPSLPSPLPPSHPPPPPPHPHANATSRQHSALVWFAVQCSKAEQCTVSCGYDHMPVSRGHA